jgi:4'-phosphopantetheinyl transferase
MAARELTAADVDVWLVPRPLLLRDPLLLARYEALLSSGERERLARIVHEETRHEYLVARALVRATLSRYDAAVAPRAWRFDVNAFGRPSLAAGQTALDLRFNLSHAHGLIACAVTLGRAVGIDVEWNRRGGSSLLESIEHFFSPSEAEETMTLPAELRVARFFQVWTLKESYIKAHGKGLSIPLADFSFRFDGEGGAVRLEPCPGDGAERWRSWVWNPSDEHTLAVTAEFAAGDEVRMQIETVAP